MNRLFALALIWTFTATAHATLLDREQRMMGCARDLSGAKVEFVRGHSAILVRAPGLSRDISTVTYDLNFTLSNFGLSLSQLKPLVYGKKVVLVGEGFGPLLPAVLVANGRVTAVDPLYALPSVWHLNARGATNSMMTALGSIDIFLRKYFPLLRAGTAQQIPLEADSQDVYFAHFVFNNFSNEDRQIVWSYVEEGFREGLRVVKPGGFVYNAIPLDGARAKILEDFLNMLKAEGKLTRFEITQLPRRVAVGRPENGMELERSFEVVRIFIVR